MPYPGNTISIVCYFKLFVTCRLSRYWCVSERCKVRSFLWCIQHPNHHIWGRAWISARFACKNVRKYLLIHFAVNNTANLMPALNTNLDFENLQYIRGILNCSKCQQTCHDWLTTVSWFHHYICWHLYWWCAFDLDEEFVDEKAVCTLRAANIIHDVKKQIKLKH